jgi:hypothetical protein
MKKNLLFAVLLFSPVLLAIQPNSDKILFLKKSSSEIIIDGYIDEVWSEADSVYEFFQLQPYFNAEPSFKTIAKILTTEDAIYCLMICYQHPGKIVANTGTQDNFSGDLVSVMFDTFRDKRTAYKFGVSASGVRYDTRLLDDARNRDNTWDGIWFADARVYNWGYVVEMKIPYKTVQYDEKLTEWGLDFDRWIPDNAEDLYWCRYEENEGQRVSKFGRLVFTDYHPNVKGLNLEFYPVGLSKTTYLGNGKYKVDPDAGIDIFYNPSQKLTYQLTGNPDFAQIEADPFTFNISRYESYLGERRPFFTQGNEIFMPSGRQSGTGFYSPLELFYSRRIGRILPGGTEVPLTFGTKATGRIADWEYGGFLANTAETEYFINDETRIEPAAYFGSARVRKQIMGNSSVGVLFVGKHTRENNYGVFDIDGAFRGDNWQLSYQAARSFINSEGDYAASAGFTKFEEGWMYLAKSRYVGNDFNIDQVGYVPWRGTAQFVGLTGPRWYYETGYIRSILIYAGPAFAYEKEDNYTDVIGIFGYNMQFRDNWGGEINLESGRSKDAGKEYSYYSTNFSTWFNVSAKWSGNLWGGYSRNYNFLRDWLAFYSWGGTSFSWNVSQMLRIGTSLNTWIEGNPSGGVEDVTINTRPYFSFTPINYLNIRFYVDNVYVRSSDQMERIIIGLLFSYNFLPKSWIYLAVNEMQERDEIFNNSGNVKRREMVTSSRAAVLKIKYLYYF